MRYFLFNKIQHRAVDHVDPFIGERIDVYMRIYDSGGRSDGTDSPNNIYNFYVEEWRDETCLQHFKFASIYKPNSEYAKWAREEAAAKHHFNMVHLVSLTVPTNEFDNMIHAFKIEPIIIN